MKRRLKRKIRYAVDRWKESLLPEETNEQSLDYKDRCLTILAFTFISVIHCIPFSILYWGSGSSFTGKVILATIFPLLLTVVIQKQTKSSILAGNWLVACGYALFTVLACYTGGMRAPALTWSISLPVIATLIAGKKTGLAWLVLTGFQLGGFYLLDKQGTAFQQQFSPAGLEIVYLSTLIGLGLFLVLLTFTYEYFRLAYLDRILALGRLIPICSWCKKIRDDKGYWDKLESYLQKNSAAKFTHGICPECEGKFTEKKPETEDFSRNS